MCPDQQKGGEHNAEVQVILFLSACLSQQEFCLSGKTESAVISVCVLLHVSLVPGGLEVTS